MKKTPDRKWGWQGRIFFGFVIIVGVAGVLYYALSSMKSARMEVKSILSELGGISFQRVREISPRRLELLQLRLARKEKSENGKEHVFSAAKGVVKLAPDRVGGEPVVREIQLNNVIIRSFPEFYNRVLLVALNRKLPMDLTFSAVGHWLPYSRNTEGYEFAFRWENIDRSGESEFSVSFQKPQLRIEGEFVHASRQLKLRFSGQITPDFIRALRLELPAPLTVPETFEISGVTRIDCRKNDLSAPLFANCRFYEPLSLSGGFWNLASGGRCSFSWRGSGQPWKLLLPDTTLTRPLQLPLGTLTVEGGNLREWSFAVEGVPAGAGGEGTFRIVGRIDREHDSWEFRQLESSTRTVPWRTETPMGALAIAWSSPKLSGAGKGASGEVDFSFDFESFRFRPKVETRDFQTRSGVFFGRWKFDFRTPGKNAFQLSAELRPEMIQWQDARSAWNAVRSRVGFELTGKPADTVWNLRCLCQAEALHLLGTGLPKLRIENPKFNWTAQFDSASPGNWPRKVTGDFDASKVQIVGSSFGSGSLDRLAMNGSVELEPQGKMLSHRYSGRAGRLELNSSGIRLFADQMVFHGNFLRDKLEIGDNLLLNYQFSNLRLEGADSVLRSPKADGGVGGEVRGEAFFPERWNTFVNLHAGRSKSGNVGGSFDDFRLKTVFLGGSPEGFQLTGRNFNFGWLSQPAAGQPVWNLLFPQLAVTGRRGPQGFSGTLNGRGGEFLLRRDDVRLIRLDKMNLRLPFGQTAGKGSFQLASEQTPETFPARASGDLEWADGKLKFIGKAETDYLSGPLGVSGELGRGSGGDWAFQTRLTLRDTQLRKPWNVGVYFPASALTLASGRLSLDSSFQLASGTLAEHCSLRLADVEAGNQFFRVHGLNGSFVLPGWDGNAKAGAELDFREFQLERLRFFNGTFRLRTPSRDECDVVVLRGGVCGGQAKLESPVSFRLNQKKTEEFSLALSNLRLARLCEMLGLPTGLFNGTVSGTMQWAFVPGAGARFRQGNFYSGNVNSLNLDRLESFLETDSDGGSSRNFLLRSLRNFKCRILKLNCRLEETGKQAVLRLELSVTGRPDRKKDGREYRRLFDAIDFNEDLEILATYRIPWKSFPGK